MAYVGPLALSLQGECNVETMQRCCLSHNTAVKLFVVTDDCRRRYVGHTNGCKRLSDVDLLFGDSCTLPIRWPASEVVKFGQAQLQLICLMVSKLFALQLALQLLQRCLMGFQLRSPQLVLALLSFHKRQEALMQPVEFQRSSFFSLLTFACTTQENRLG